MSIVLSICYFGKLNSEFMHLFSHYLRYYDWISCLIVSIVIILIWRSVSLHFCINHFNSQDLSNIYRMQELWMNLITYITCLRNKHISNGCKIKPQYLNFQWLIGPFSIYVAKQQRTKWNHKTFFFLSFNDCV